MVGIISIAEMSVLGSLEEILKDWQRKRKPANSTLFGFNIIQGQMKALKMHLD